MGNIGPWQLLIVLLIIVLLFGTKKLRGLGSDLGDAVKGFKKAVSEEKPDDNQSANTPPLPSQTHNVNEQKTPNDQTKV